MKAIALFVLILFSTAAFAQQPQASTLSGKILDSSGVPLRKSTVTLRPTGFVPLKPGDLPPQPYEATTDAEGKFLFTGIDTGKYTLSAEHPGYLRANYAPGGNPKSAPTILNVLAGHDMTDLAIKLIEQSVITGKVVDDDGDPVTRVQVRLSRLGYQQGRRQFVPVGGSGTDEKGEFRMSGISGGKYYLNAEPYPAPGGAPRPARAGQPEERWVNTWYPGVLDTGAATMISVPAAQTVSGMNIRMQKSIVVNVRGKVNGVGSDLSRTRVMLTPLGGANFFNGINSSATIAKDGSFDLAGIAPGRYELEVAKMEGPMQVTGTRAIDVGKQDVADLSLSAGLLPDLHGSLRIEGTDKPSVPDASGATSPNKPAPQFRVVAAPDSAAFFNVPPATVQDDGSFAISGLGVLKYSIRMEMLPPGSYLKSVSLGGRNALEEGIDLTAGPVESTLQIVISQAAAQIDGTALDGDGKPAPGSMVTLIPDPPRPEKSYLYQTANTDQNGQFQFRSVRPGRYRLYAWEQIDFGNQFDPDVAKGLEDRGTAVTVAENDHQQFSVTRISIAQAEEVARRYGR